MSIVIEPTLTPRFELVDDAKPAEDAHWYWPLPRLAGESPRILAYANDDRGGVDLGYLRLAFRELFVPGMHKSQLVGMFLAILELVRHHRAKAEQASLFGEIWVSPGERTAAEIDPDSVDNYDRRER